MKQNKNIRSIIQSCTRNKQIDELMSIISLPDLPVEILHLICDCLDALTIVRSFRYVCKHLHAITDSYNRYTVDITSMSTSALTYLSTQIQPESIISLIFSTDYWSRDQSKLFRSIFDISRFTTLHSLALFDGPDYDRQNSFLLIPVAQVRRDFHIKEIIFLCSFVSL